MSASNEEFRQLGQNARATVMRSSNGGSSTLRVGLRHPDKVRRLVVISAMYRRAGMVPGFWEGLAGATMASMAERPVPR